MRTRDEARRGLTIYLSVLAALSALLEFTIIRIGGLTNSTAGALVLVLMYVPAFASVVARMIGREGFADASFGWGGRSGTFASLGAWLMPLAVAIPAYGLAWGTGLVGFAAPPDGVLKAIADPVARIVVSIPVALTAGTVLSCLSAFGEEVGWRGYLVPRLVEAEIPGPYLVSALVWCAWHIPLILWGGYATGSNHVLSALLFVACIAPVGLLFAKWRMTSGSVWPTVIGHGSWNIIIQAVFDPFTTGTDRTTWVGESGIFTVAMVWLACYALWRRPWAGTAPVPARAAS